MTEKCQYPGCQKKACKTWALVNLCEEHFENVRKETLQYYGHTSGMFHIPYDERDYFLNIAALIPWRRKYKK